MIFITQKDYEACCEQGFLGLQKPLSRWRKNFFKDALWFFLCFAGRANFLQLGRYGRHGEQRYRGQFARPFDFLNFNAALVRQHGSPQRAIAFDPTYLPKAGRQTFGKGTFWSGCAGKAKPGLELGGIAALDLENHTALHLEAVQTVPPAEEGDLMRGYIKALVDRKEVLLSLSTVLVVDAYFSKQPFVDAMVEAGFHVVSRLRSDARLRYLLPPQKTGKRGRPKQFAGKVDPRCPDMAYFTLAAQDDPACRVYVAPLNVVALRRTVKVALVHHLDEQGELEDYKLYFSTEVEMDGLHLWQAYKGRFQIEFLYRDGKQHTGLTHCQARDESKLHFHCNLALTAVNVAKITSWLPQPKDKRGPFSMALVKTMNHNAWLLDRIFAMCAPRLNLHKYKDKLLKLLMRGTNVT
jgi:hypothetical protein